MIPENIAKFLEVVLADRKMKIRKLVNIIGSSEERIGHIIHEVLQMKKLCARGEPRCSFTKTSLRLI